MSLTTRRATLTGGAPSETILDSATATGGGVHPSLEGEIHGADRWLQALERVLS